VIETDTEHKRQTNLIMPHLAKTLLVSLGGAFDLEPWQSYRYHRHRSVFTGNMFMIELLFVDYLWNVRRVSAAKQSGHSAAATESTNSAVNDAYQELSTMPASQPVYSQLAR